MKTKTPSQAFMLNTERLILQNIEVGDSAFVLELLNTPGWLQFIGDRGVRSIRDGEQYINSSIIQHYKTHGYGLFKIILKSSEKPIGVCGLLKRKSLDHPDLGFAILPDYGGKGYTFEASQGVLQYAKELGYNKILALTHKQNTTSQNLLKKLGFTFQEIVKLEEFDGKSALFEKGF